MDKCSWLRLLLWQCAFYNVLRKTNSSCNILHRLASSGLQLWTMCYWYFWDIYSYFFFKILTVRLEMNQNTRSILRCLQKSCFVCYMKLPFCCDFHCQETGLTFSARFVFCVCYHFQFYFFNLFIHLRFLLSFSTPTFASIAKYGNDVKWKYVFTGAHLSSYERIHCVNISVCLLSQIGYSV